MTESETDSEFFLVVAPGLENVAQRELQAWAPELAPELSRGGLTIRASMERGLGLNRFLKVPTRILVRISQFTCRDFPKLFKKMQALDWERWVGDDHALTFKASSQSSRLFVKKRIEETCRDGRAAYQKKRGMKSREDLEPVQVFVRLDDNVCTVSLDTSGDRLHKRGVREMSSDAPLRESIAAALLWSLEELAGEVAPSSVELVDPMAGGGTFLLEARGLKRQVQSREFAFESWGGRETVVAEQETQAYAASPDVYASWTGFEIDPKTALAARANWESQGAGELQLIEADFFKGAPLPPTLPGQRRWLICNPPYGQRISVKGPLKTYYQELFAAAERVVRPERACFLIPDTAKPRELVIPKTWRKAGALRLTNGGLPVTALLFQRGND